MEQTLFLDFLASLQKLFVGYIPAAVFGSFIGYFIGINVTVYQIFRRIFQIPHSIPPLALLPIALILFQDSEPASVMVIFLATFWTVIINVAIGLQHFRRQNNNFRAAIFHVFHSLKVGIWVAWFTVIAIEMLIGPRGLGFILWESYKAGNTNSMIQVLLYIGIIGTLLDQFLDFMGSLLAQMISENKKSS
ncbi:nitrate transporter [Nostoc sp. FACHB-87]|uniref:ABC transporter permease n=1 Tax=Nostocales TaxID=1161 RepID=UPI00168993E3|nr:MULTISPECIES: nitrate transporter [Nostocales]MBD2303405.1 nitrate transporter [Nostoc sp. FACHB-190]MBD2453902.1 nitrate transporter [Nostoc sp. FACHB-87]MBD2476025.1 nitrate transporter [Anabaena sp. FACHB-83]MBD2489694.1 nitrate transporter [Aulosira sp. FACHB-615]